MAEPEVRYCTTEDDVRIAYTVTGDGPPVVVCGDPIASHVQLEWSHPLFKVLFGELARSNTVIRFDPRGCGLSDRVLPQTLDEWVLDIEAVVKRAGFHEFALMGLQVGSPPAIAFAARHADQVSRLVLFDGYARVCDMFNTAQVQAMFAAAKADWTMATESMGFAAFGSAREESLPHGAYIRSCVGPEFFEHQAVLATFDASELARSVTAPTLVLKHSGVQYVTMEMVKDIAARIPNAQLAVVEGTWADDPKGVLRRAAAFINAGVADTSDFKDDSVPPPPRSALGQFVTIVFTDIERNTEILSRLGDAAWRELLREHERITRRLLEEHRGAEIKTIGDAFMASFGSATAALECAVALQLAFAARNESTAEPIQVRIGVNAGEPIAEGRDLFGTAVTMASRIAGTAAGGEIVVSNVVRELAAGKGFLFADRGEFVAKGFEEPVRVYEVRWRDDS